MDDDEGSEARPSEPFLLWEMRMRWLRAMVGLAVVVGSAGMRAQDPLVTLPQNYKVIFENDDVAVIRAHYGPHERVPVHDHPSVSTVFVYLNDSGKVRIDHTDGAAVESVVRPPTVKGSYRVAPGLAERHSIENLGDTPSDFLRVELKRVKLEMNEPFRGKAPAQLVAGDAVEFDTPGVQVERIVCEESNGCSVRGTAAPSLLIAFGKLSLQVSAGSRTEMSNGSVVWLPASQPATIGCGQVDCPGQVLRILLPEKK